MVFPSKCATAKGKTTTYPSTDEWKTKCGTHKTEYYSAIKRNVLLTHATTGVNLEETVLSKISHI
jgi:hypothetical protein